MARPRRPRCSTSRNCEQRIGARVSASSSESSDRDRDGDAELEEELADDPLHEGDRQEDRDDGQGGGGGGEGDLARADRRGPHLALAHLAVPVDVLEHHDGVVDDDADDQRQAEHGVGVEGEAEEVDDDEGAEDRGRDGQQDVDGGRPRAEEQPADEAGEERGEEQREQDLVDRALDEGGGVPVDVEPQPLGQLRAQRSPSCALTSRPTWTALAPRSLVMPKPIDGSPIARLSRRRSSRPSSTTATSFRRTGAPFA